jgi:hypothetical protein
MMNGGKGAIGPTAAATADRAAATAAVAPTAIR